jgi:hypothetical protein
MRTWTALLLFCFLVASPAAALSKDAAESRASELLRALLLKDVDKASQYTTVDVQPWIDMLRETFPESIEGPTRFEIMDVTGTKNARRCVAEVERGSVAEIYYIDLDDDTVVRVVTVKQLAAFLEKEIRAELERLSDSIASWNSGTSKPQFVRQAVGDYISVVDELRDEIDGYLEWLKYNKPPPGKQPNYGSFSERRK